MKVSLSCNNRNFFRMFQRFRMSVLALRKTKSQLKHLRLYRFLLRSQNPWRIAHQSIGHTMNWPRSPMWKLSLVCSVRPIWHQKSPEQTALRTVCFQLYISSSHTTGTLRLCPTTTLLSPILTPISLSGTTMSRASNRKTISKVGWTRVTAAEIRNFINITALKRFKKMKLRGSCVTSEKNWISRLRMKNIHQISLSTTFIRVILWPSDVTGRESANLGLKRATKMSRLASAKPRKACYSQTRIASRTTAGRTNQRKFIWRLESIMIIIDCFFNN